MQSLFHKQTIGKAGRDWRLLVLDGHGSHCTLSFLEWCRNNRILAAVFPPHSTHRLQPLDVGLFGPLATYYSQSLDAHSRLSQGLASVTKRDFFKNFYSAFDNAFTEANIRSGWLKTGIEHFDPNQVLKIFDEKGGDRPEASGVESLPSRHSSSCLDTPSAQRTIRRTVNEAVAERDAKTEKISESWAVRVSPCLPSSRWRKTVRRAMLKLSMRRRRKGSVGSRSPRSLERMGVSAGCFFSPSKVKKARELQDAKEAVKEREALEKVSQAEARAASKAQKDSEAQRKREERAARAEGRKAEGALKKAQREQGR